MFEKLIGNAKLKEVFKRLIETDRVPHSLLFTGLEGVGKRQFAIEIAKSLVCKNLASQFACLECSGCVRAERFEFPKFDDKEEHEKVIWSENTDVGTIIPYRNNILVKAIRELEREANFRPYESKARVFIIDDADKMNDSAANALLKTLEEPSETIYLFLITSRPSALLPTIHSRCQTINFAPVETSEIEKFLIGSEKLPGEDAKLVAQISRGSIAKASNIDLEYYCQQRTKMLDVIRSLNSGKNLSILLRTSEELSDAKNRDSYEDNLNILQNVIFDIWTLSNNSNTEIVNFDIRENIQHIAENTNKDRLSRWLTEIETLLDSLKSNLNRKVATDALFMKMAG